MLLASELDIATRTVWMEARGEPYEGKKAVAQVLINRWLSRDGQFRKDDTLASACLRHAQFSGWTPGDSNFRKAYFASLSEQVFRECMRAVLETFDDPEPWLQDVMHYHAAEVSPFWAEGHVPVRVVGRHLFYEGVK